MRSQRRLQQLLSAQPEQSLQLFHHWTAAFGRGSRADPVQRGKRDGGTVPLVNCRIRGVAAEMRTDQTTEITGAGA